MKEIHQDIKLVLSSGLHDTALCHNEGRDLWELLELDFSFLGRASSNGESYYLYQGDPKTEHDIAHFVHSKLSNVVNAVGNDKFQYCIKGASKCNGVKSFGNELLIDLFEKGGFSNPH